MGSQGCGTHFKAARMLFIVQGVSEECDNGYITNRSEHFPFIPDHKLLECQAFKTAKKKVLSVSVEHVKNEQRQCSECLCHIRGQKATLNTCDVYVFHHLVSVGE